MVEEREVRARALLARLCFSNCPSLDEKCPVRAERVRVTSERSV